MSDTLVSDDRRFADWRLALKSVLGFWAVYLSTVIVRAFLGADPLTVLQNKVLTIGLGILLTFLVYAIIVAFGYRRNLRANAIVAVIASLLVALVQAVLLMAAEPHFKMSKEEFRWQTREGFVVIERGREIRIERRANDPLVVTMPPMRDLDPNKQVRIAADSAVVWFFFFGAWSAFYLAMRAQSQAHQAQRRLVHAEAAAQAAQVRALRYQVNPHFLFNTLNSLSALVMSGRNERAEEMLLALSTFFRTSLSLNATADVSLEEEIELQRLYLDIEKVRFPSRLRVEIDIPDELMAARLPALILQPIVENAIKYGVSRTRGRVTLRIAATKLDPGRFEIRITNDGKPDSPAKAENGGGNGTGVGLDNVCQRLDARFGGRANCRFGPTDDGGFEVRLILPFERTDG